MNSDIVINVGLLVLFIGFATHNLSLIRDRRASGFTCFLTVCEIALAASIWLHLMNPTAIK